MAIVYIEHYTYEDYKKWKGDWELIGGMPYAMAPAPAKRHQLLSSAIVTQFYTQLENCINCEVLIEEDYKISEDTILRPDISVVCNDLNPNFISKAPEIIVEIISPSTAKRDEKLKFSIYEFEKVKYYILVYPDELKAKIFKHNDEKYIKEGDFLTQTYEFNTSCGKVKLDFERAFRRYRNIK
ncbi:hypothetical protein JCM11957_12640 [Caminibacter profundus]